MVCVRLSDAALAKAKAPVPERRINLLRGALDGVWNPNERFDIVIDPLGFDWVNRGEDRNWWWTVQQLPTLELGAGDLLESSDIAPEKVHEFNHAVVRKWLLHCGDLSTDVPLAWNDLAATFRLRNLFRYTNALIAHRPDYAALGFFVALVEEHSSWLAEEKNWSKGTNHGFFQARVMVEVAEGWPDVLGDYLPTGLGRLAFEVNSQFTSEGVHVENSPAYHLTISRNLKQLAEYLSATGLDLPGVDIPRLLRDAEQWAVDILTPSGDVPLIGDSESKPPQSIPAGIKPQFGIVDKSASGWVVIREPKTETLPEAHLIFKNQHLSSYHRHDDDLAVHFSVGNDVFFGDSGLWSYQEDHPTRKYLRSSLAHSSVHIDGAKPIRKPGLLLAAPETTLGRDRSWIQGRSWATEGWQIQRRLELYDSLRLWRIVDSVEPRSDVEGPPLEDPWEMVSVFVVPAGIEVKCTRQGAVLSGQFARVTLECGGLSGEVPAISCDSGAIMSPTYGAIERCTRLAFSQKSESAKVIFDVTVEGMGSQMVTAQGA